MKFIPRIALTGILLVTVGLNFLFGVNLAQALAQRGGVDVYIIFSSKDKKAKEAFSQSFQGDVSLKSYNVDLLALADYSGKQKIIAKLERAKIILVVKDAPQELLKGTTFKNDIIILNSATKQLRSENRTLCIVNDDVNLSALENKTSYFVKTAADLLSSEALLDSEAVLVNETKLDTSQIAALIVEKLLNH